MDCKTWQGDYFKRNSAYFYVSSGLFVALLDWHGKTLKYLHGTG